MNKLNRASKRELNPFWVFLPCFFAKGDVNLWVVLLFREIMGYFVACSLGAAQIQEGSYRCASQVFHKQGQQKRVCRDLPLKTQRMDSLLGGGLAFFTSGSFHVLVGCPWNGHRLCHCARNIVLSFMLLLLLLNYNMWLLFYYYFLFECFTNLLSLWICWCTVPLLLWIKIKRTV